MDKNASILVVDDEKEIADVIELYLKNDQYNVLKFYTGQEALDCIASTKIDLAILDIMLPGEDGYSILESLKLSRDTRGIPVIMVTAKEAEYDKVKGLEAGADDYITKPFGMMEFVARVKAVLRRCSKQEDDKELRYGDLSLSVGKHKVHWKDTSVELTRKEFELLQYLMENKGLVMSRNQILCHVWGYDFDGETRTVDVHVRTLRQKLGEAGNLIETVRGVGYRIGV